jgi:glutathione S-transferase
MSLTFYYAPMSSASIVTLVLEELGVPHEKVKVDLSKGDTRKPEFLKINPNGKVPVLVHDGVVLWESAAINIHLGETFGVEKNLFPAPGPKRGEALKWIVWANVSLGEALARLQSHTAERFPAEQRNALAAEVAKKDIAKLVGILDAALAGKSYLTGDYTIVDTHVNAMMSYLKYVGIDTSTFANVTAWSKRCCERPAFVRAMQAT